MKKRSFKHIGIIAAVGAILVAGTVFVAFGGAKKIIHIGEDTRGEIDLENGTTTETPIGGTGATEAGDPVLSAGATETEGQVSGAEGAETGASTGDVAVPEGGAAGDPAASTLRIVGVVLEAGEDSILLDRQFPEGGHEDTILHIDPERTLILDSVSGFPTEAGQIKKGDSLYVYVGPAMTMSLPPQMTAVLILTGTPQDAAAPQYVQAAGSLEADGQGGWILKGTDGAEIFVPADCPIEPYLTRQIVRLSDITAGRTCLVWTGMDGTAEKIVLFNE